MDDSEALRFASKDGRQFVSLLLRPKFVVLSALLESLDLGDEEKSSDEVANVLLTFLGEYGKTVEFLCMVISREVASLDDNPNTLFRRNSVASKMLSRYTAENGAAFLNSVLGEMLRKAEPMNATDTELNPEKGGGSGNAPNLALLCEVVLKASIAAVKEWPLELRQLGEYLRLEVAKKFGEKMGVAAVGGYVFLRFVCPAMIAPERYSIRGDVSKDAKRILMSVSKVIQSLANGMTSFKEEHMRPLDAFLQNNSGPFASFLGTMSSVSPEELPPPLPFDTLPLDLTQASRAALLAIHRHLKRNIHKIGSVVAALDSHAGLQSLKTSAEKSGWLFKRGGSVKSWKKRWFVLKDNQLVYFDNPHAGSASGRIPLEGTSLYIMSELEFTIKTEYRTFEIQAESEGDAKDWVRSLTQAIGRLEGTARSGAVPALVAQRSSSNLALSDGDGPSLELSEDNVRGWLKKAGPKGTGWKKRWFILNGNLLVYFKAPNDSTPQGEIKIDDARIRVIDATRFNIEASTRTFFLQASSEKEKTAWVNTLNAMRVKFVKQLVSEGADKMLLQSPEEPVDLKSSSSLKISIPDQIWSIESQAILKEGILFKQGGQIKTWKQRWFVLRSHQLYYYKASADKEPLGSIPLSNSKITLTEKTSFEVLTGKRNFFLRANSKAETEAWIDALTAAAQAVSTVDKLQVVPEKLEEPMTGSQGVVCEGYLLKEGGKMKKWQQRYFVLQGPLVSYFKEKGDEQAAGVIPVNHCSVALAEEKVGKKNAFEIATRYRNYFLVAKDEFEMAKWMRHIEQAKSLAEGRKGSISEGMGENMKVFFALNDILQEWEKE